MSLFYPSRQQTPFTILSNANDTSYTRPNADIGARTSTAGTNVVNMLTGLPANFLPQIATVDEFYFSFTSVAESPGRNIPSFNRSAIGGLMPLFSNKYQRKKPYIFDLQCSWEIGNANSQYAISWSFVLARYDGNNSSRIMATIPFSDLPEGHFNHRIIQAPEPSYTHFAIGLMATNYTLGQQSVSESLGVNIRMARSFEPISVNDAIII